MNDVLTHDKVVPANPQAKEIAEAIINLLFAEEKLKVAIDRTPNYTAQWKREDFFALEQEKWNRSADNLYARLFPKIEKNNKNTSPLIEAFQNLLNYAERQICPHDTTHRGGAIWEICDDCGKKWADDEGGKPKEFHFPKEIEDAQRILDLYTFKLKNQQ